MGVISLRNGAVFTHCNNFIVRELMGLMAAEMPGDAEADSKFKLAETVNALMLDTVEDPALAERLERVMLRVAQAVVDGRAPLTSTPFQYPENRKMFVDSMRMLVRFMVHPVEGGPPP